MIFGKKKYNAGFFDGASLRAAVVSRDAKDLSVFREQSYSVQSGFEDESLLSLVSDFGRRIRLVVSEEGVYTFSVTLPNSSLGSPETLKHELHSFFPESSESTLWDSKVVSSGTTQALLEVTELKKSWADKLLAWNMEKGIIFESIIPESSAIALLTEEEASVVILHRKSEDSLLLIFAESGNILVSLLLRKPFSVDDISGFLRFCKEKKGKEPRKIICSGFDAETLKPLSLDIETVSRTLDPIFGVAYTHPYRKERAILDLSDSLPKTIKRFFFWK